MERDLKQLADREHDVLVVGGGIYGAAAVREAALSGLSAALIEKSDFGGATSANTLKIIHGGLRYLQQADFVRMRESIGERRTIQKIAPHLVAPLSCVMPTQRGSLMKNPLTMFCALTANDLISFDRNHGLDPARHLPRGGIISKEQCLQLIPGLDGAAVTGGAAWYDALAFSTERLTLGMVRSAADAGAVVANYIKCTGFSRDRDSVTGVYAQDLLSQQDFVIRAKMVINNTGPWALEALAPLGGGITLPHPQLGLGINFVLKRDPISSHAVGLVSTPGDGRPGRLLFFVPWRGRCLVGTYYRPHEGFADNMRVRPEDIEAFLADVNRAHPVLNVTADDIGLVHAGLLPATDFPVGGGEPKLRRHPEMIDHAVRDKVKGLITIRGVKYTTARLVAQHTIALAAQHLGATLKPSRSDALPLPGGDIADIRRFEADAMPGVTAEIGEVSAGHLLRCYGSEYRAVLDEADGVSASLARLDHDTETTAAEVLFGVRREMARKLSDIAFRRTDLAAAAQPSDHALQAAAAIMATELKWDADRTNREIAEVQSVFAIGSG